MGEKEIAFCRNDLTYWLSTTQFSALKPQVKTQTAKMDCFIYILVHMCIYKKQG